MKKLILMVGLIVVGIACGDAVGEMLDVPDAGAEMPGDGSSMQYVGNSTEALSGGQGIYTYYAACQTTFGPGHRMCTGNEIIYTVKIPQLSEGSAWYEPSFQCAGGSASRPTVNQVGRTTAVNCQNLLPVACCGPK